MRPTPVEAARRAKSLCVDMSACSLLHSIAKRESAPRDTGDSKTKLPPRMCVIKISPPDGSPALTGGLTVASL
eukprot:4899788-Pleurochrysis_carterae.AAC.1